jgi:hypothetical protein
VRAVSRGIIAISAVILVAATGAMPALAADRAITRDATAANVSAHNGQLAWSRLAKDGRAKLVAQIRGKSRDLPVRAKAGLFDPDLGSNPSGQLVVVYTRCAGVSGRNCDVYEYNRATRRERKLPGASSPNCSEYAPSVWIGSVAFARAGSAECNGLYLLRRGNLRKLDTRVPAQTDIRGSGVAYLHIPPNDVDRTFIRVRSLYKGRSRILVTGFAAEGESYRVSNPVMYGRYTYWLQQDRVRNEFFAGRGLSARRAPLQFSDRLFPGAVDSLAVTRTGKYYTNGQGLFQATDPEPTFAARE